MNTDLQQHYLDTIYFIYIDAEQYGVKIGEENLPVIKRLFDTYHTSTAAILTAWNPRSQAIDFKQNKLRNYDLYNRLKDNKYPFYEALGKGKDPQWSAEEGYIIVGIDKETADELAEQYEQNAYVWLEQDKPVTLEYTSIWYE